MRSWKAIRKNLRHCLSLLFLFSHCTFSQQPQGIIHLNQLGFYPDAPKVAAVSEVTSDKYYVCTTEQDTVFTGTLSGERIASYSPKKVKTADFSGLTTPGTFVLIVPGINKSYPFEIKEEVHNDLAKGSLKGFYFQRMSTALPEKFAGKWNRPTAHPDDHVLVHASAASGKRPEGTVISSPKGWYDAGDYNKYIVNSGITVGTMLSLYEDHPSYSTSLSIAIPESENDIPDLLDEILWNLRWMLTMQDPHDGGVYHKLTNPSFDKMAMPDACTGPRYVVQKSTPATLDFAAVMAQASRIFKNFSKELPGLSDSCMLSAVRAWEWAIANPDKLYNQQSLNQQFDPDINTGAYGDRSADDEFLWAAVELLISTKDEKYYQAVKLIPDEKMPLPSWNQVRLLGYYTLIRHEKLLPVSVTKDVSVIKQNLIKTASEWVVEAKENPYQMVMGLTARDFIWGSSSVAANQGILLLQAYNLTSDKKFLHAAVANLDYLLGRNATGYSFVTGFGDKTPMHPHHRPSEADGVDEPVPGLLTGGPNSGKQDKCNYPSLVPNEAFVDDVCSYASNEIAINWNAPLVYLVWAIEAIHRP